MSTHAIPTPPTPPPASGAAAPRDIAGRIQAVISLCDGAGLQLDPLTIAEMLELPDLDALEEELIATRGLLWRR